MIKNYLSKYYSTLFSYKLLLSSMPIEDFIVKDELGKGSFGAVFKAIRKED